MVRKRGRGRGSVAGFKRRSSRTCDNSDDNESDVDLDLESPPASPEGPRRYGLRQRANKRPILTDYYYDDDDETIPTKDASEDDQDYDITEDLQEEHIRVVEKIIVSNHVEKRGLTRVSPREKLRDEPEGVITEAHAEDPLALSQEETRSESQDGPVDFEDIIRADVVNKQKVDYDNVVNKTEIHVEPLPLLLKISRVQKVKAPTGRRRGRRAKEPRNEPEYHITADCSEHNVNNIITNGDSNDETMEVQLDPTEMMQTEYLDDPRGNKPRSPKENGVSKSDDDDQSKEHLNSLNKKPNGVTVPITIKPMDLPEVETPPNLDPKEKEVVLSNEYLLANAFDYSADEFVKKLEEDKNKPAVDEEPVQQLIFDSDEDSDDDVILIEKKPEIIVLDDDD